MQSGRIPNKMWVDKGSKFYYRSMESWLHENDIETYLTYNKGKFFVGERFIRTLKNNVCKYMTSISKNLYTNN